jgi:hypothetical protein
MGGPACKIIKIQGLLNKIATNDRCAQVWPRVEHDLSRRSQIRWLREWWTAPWSQATSPRWTSLIIWRGTWSRPSITDRTAQDMSKRGATVGVPETRAVLWRGGARRHFPGAALDRATGHRFVREWPLRVAERHAHTSRGSRRRVGLPRRPAPKGGNAGFVGVRAPVLQCVWRSRNGGKVTLTTRRRSRSVCRRGWSCCREDWQKRRARAAHQRTGAQLLSGS